MKEVDVAEAGTHLAELMAEAQRGEDIVLTRQGRPIGRIVPLGPPPGVPASPDTQKVLENLARLRSAIAARGVSFTEDDLRAARDDAFG